MSINDRAKSSQLNTKKTQRGSALTASNLREVRHGSALIMVMLVIAGITTIVFATQRIALVQFSQSVREEDNLTAFYAAKAGIEDGLVRYRFERNTETSKNKKFRFNITRATYPVSNEIDSDVGIEEGVDGDFDPNYQYYDSVVSFKTQRINVDDSGTLLFNSNSVIARDETLTLTGFPGDSSTYFLRYGFKFDSTCPNLDKAFVSLQQIATASSGVNSSLQQIAKYSPSLIDQTFDSKNTASNLLIQAPSGASKISSIRVKPFHCQVQFAFATTTSNDGLGSSNDAGPEFDSLTTEILSTGYFGSAKRTLIAQVDRRTGNLIDVFDYILYSGGNTGTIRRGF